MILRFPAVPLLLLLVSVFLEVLTWWSVFQGALATALVLHVFSSIAFLPAAYGMLGESKGSALMCLLLHLLVPGPGSVTAFFLLGALVYSPPEPADLVPERDEVPGVPPITVALRESGVRLRRGLSLDREVQPAVEPLLTGSRSERRAALEVVAELGESHHVELLKRALNDDDREIFQLAHAKLNQLHEYHNRAVKKAREQPEEIRDRSFLDACLDYISSGLLGDSTKAYYGQQALEATARLEERGSTPSSELILIQGQLHQMLGRWEDALHRFRVVCSREPDNVDAHWGAAECYLELGQRTEMLSSLKVLSKLQPPRNVLETALWCLKGVPNG